MKFWVYDSGKRDARGPFEIADLKRLPALSPELIVAPEGATGPDAWRPAKTYEELRVLFIKPPPLPTDRVVPQSKPPDRPQPEQAASRAPITERLRGVVIRGASHQAIAVVAATVGVVGYGLFSIVSPRAPGPRAPATGPVSTEQTLDIRVEKLEYASRINDRRQTHPEPTEGNKWCLATLAVRSLGPTSQYDPSKLKLVDDQDAGYGHTASVSLFRSLQEPASVSAGESLDGQLLYQMPKARGAQYFLYEDEHWRLKIMIPEELEAQLREEDAGRQRAEEVAARQLREQEARRQRAEKVAQRLQGTSIDYPTFFAKAKGTGLPLGRRYTFRAMVSHNFCLHDAGGYDHILCVESQIDDDNLARLEQFLKGPDRQDLNVTAAMLEGRLGPAVVILRLE